VQRLIGTTFKLELRHKKIWVAGHNGMLGSALCRLFEGEVLTVNRNVVDLRCRNSVRDWVQDNKPDVVFVAAAVVGGIRANIEKPVEFLLQNLQIQNNIIEAANDFGVQKLIFFGSACSYPKSAPQPINELSFLGGPCEETNIWYATAKIAGIKLVQAYRKQSRMDGISIMPTNCYGPGDRFDENDSHVIPSLIKKIYTAKQRRQETVELWGTGKPLREFIYVDDLASASFFLAEKYSAAGLVNVGTGDEISILNLAKKIAKIVGYEGKILFDSKKPDGVARKILDSSMLKSMGWRATTSLDEGLRVTYDWAVRSGCLE